MKFRLILKGKEYLQPITIKAHNRVTINWHIIFFTPPIVIRRTDSNILSPCRYLVKYLLTDDDKKNN